MEVTHFAVGDVVQMVLGSPVLCVDLLRKVADLLEALGDASRPRPLILSSDHPTIFLAGAHLGEIARLDAASSAAYARLGRRVLGLLSRYPAPTVAAVRGSCSGGGFDLAMVSDRIVAHPAAWFAHPGVRRGLVTGWGGTVRMPAACGRPQARALLVGGEAITADALYALGAVSRVTREPEEDAVAEARRLSALHADRLEMWRSLRSRYFVDSFRSFVVHKIC